MATITVPGPGVFRTSLPKAFLASGVNCGIRSFRPDLGLIVSELPCTAVAVFTRNSCKSAHIRYCRKLLPSNNIRAIITNSGQANTATGETGMQHNTQIAHSLAEALSCEDTNILIASTGIIGQQLAIDNILSALPELTQRLSNIAENFATAILTTDLVPKTVYKIVELSGGKVHITGICKGSGMIHPDMATMLGYLICDADLETEVAQTMLKESCDLSFNMISVDGEMSTNDTVFLLANGASGVGIRNAEDRKILQQAFDELSIMLAQSIVRDGEGATKLLEVCIQGMQDPECARTLARSLTVSPLLKTAVHGASPNWGRILSRIGASAVSEDMLAHCSISIQNIKIFSNSAPVDDVNQERLKKAMYEDTISIVVEFTEGDENATAWGCDLSKKYITINAEYVT